LIPYLGLDNIHSNVDRLFSIWQALNPQSYTINKQTPDGTFVITADSIETATTPLAPFNDASGSKYWNSEGVRQTETFNYAYPETQKWKFASDNDYANSVMTAVQQLYGGVSSQISGDQGFNLMAISSALPAARAVEAKAASHASGDGGASGSAQKQITGPAVPAPAPHHSASHPFHDFVEKVKEGFTGKSGEGSDGTRGLDLESEIGKCTSNPIRTVPNTRTAC
jgi:tyrosinase